MEENKRKKRKKKEKPSVFKPVTPATGYQASAPTCIDGRTDGRVDTWTDRQVDQKNKAFSTILENYSIYFTGFAFP